MKSVLTTVFLLVAITVFGQDVAVKTNVVYWATTTLNLGAEVGISPKMTIDLIGTYNPFKFRDNKKIMNWLIQPEWRYWACRRFAGHFWGVHAHYGKYNGGLKKYRYDGWLAGAGISYGYQWLIGKRWSLEAELGLGYAYLSFDKFIRNKCGKFVDSDHKNYVGPTKLNISFMYFFD